MTNETPFHDRARIATDYLEESGLDVRFIPELLRALAAFDERTPGRIAELVRLIEKDEIFTAEELAELDRLYPRQSESARAMRVAADVVFYLRRMVPTGSVGMAILNQDVSKTSRVAFDFRFMLYGMERQLRHTETIEMLAMKRTRAHDIAGAISVDWSQAYDRMYDEIRPYYGIRSSMVPRPTVRSIPPG